VGEAPEDRTPAVDGRADARRLHLDERSNRRRLPRLDDVDHTPLLVLEGYEVTGLYRGR
jgi:hypothetical protein